MVGNWSNFSEMWQVTKEDSQHSPSTKNGMHFLEELTWRIRGICFIEVAASRLELPLPVVGTASTLFHRFFTVASLYDYQYDTIAATCLFVACKSEETSRRALDIASIWLYECNDEDISEFADEILNYELTVIDLTCFDLDIDHPYNYLRDFCKQIEVPADVLNTCIALTNDSYRLPFNQWYGNKVLAAALLLMAFYGCDIEYIHNPDTELGKIVEESGELFPEIIGSMMDMYRMCSQNNDSPSSHQT
ncbi:cyclin-like protein [Sporodiniella umbellata]|nr:cyclin-like protein [Sporodiniella umbellata]